MARVVIISHWFEPAHGAAPYRIKNFVNFFVKKGFEVIVFTNQRDAPKKEDYLLRKIDLKSSRLYRDINNLAPHIVLFSVPPSYGIQNIRKIQNLSEKLIFDVRDPLAYSYTPKIFLKKSILWQMEKYLLEHSYLNLINSPGIEELYSKKNVMAKYYFLPNGYDIPLFSHIRTFTGKFFYFGAFNIMHSSINFYKFFKKYEKIIKKRGYTFDFYCFDSPQLNEIKEIVRDEKFNFIRFFKPILQIEFKDKLKDYSVGMTFVRTVYNYSIPSKFYTYLALGIPTMNVSFGRSIISRICRKNELGFDANPNIYDPDLFDNLEKNYEYYSQMVIKNRENYYWNNLVEEFYTLKLSWLK